MLTWTSFTRRHCHPRRPPWAVRAVACAVAIAVFAATSSPLAAQYRAYVDQSEKAQVLLKLAAKYIEESRSALAVPLLVEALDVAPDSVLPDTQQGAHLALRRMILGLSAADRQAFQEAAGEKADLALRAAEAADDCAAYARLTLRYPGTAAARQAARRLVALGFEQGRFAQTIEAADTYLADPLVSPEDRRLPTCLLALAAAELGDAGRARRAADELKAAPGGDRLTLCGREVSVAEAVARTGRNRTPDAPPWGTVFGAADRSGRGPAALSFEARLALFRDAPDEPLPVDLRAMLERATVEHNQLFETVALATSRSLLVTSGVELAAYDRATGGLRWRHRMRPFAMPMTWPSCGEGLVAATVIRAPDAPATAKAWDFIRATPLELVVLDELTGRPLWTWPTDRAADAARAGENHQPDKVAPEAAPLAPGQGEDEALDAAELREFSGLVPVGSPLVYGGRVFVGAARRSNLKILSDTYLMCFDAHGGALLWQRFVGSGPVGHLAPADHTLDRMAPVTDGQRVYIQGGAGTVVAIDLATGAVAWARSYDQPRPDGRTTDFVAGTQWPSTIPDGPTVVAGRLITSDVYGPVLRCVDTAGGDTLWEVKKMTPMWRLGVQEGVVFWAGASTLIGYGLDSGEQRAKVALPGEVTGRGFVSPDAAYVPTAVGVVRVSLDDGSVAVVVGIAGESSPPRCVVPVGNLVLCVADDSIRLFGAGDALLAEARASLAASRQAPICELWLGDLFLQRGDFAQADAHLRAALATLDKSAAATSPQLRGMVTARLVSLARQWAANLRKGGHAGDALARLQQTAALATDPLDKLLAAAALAEHFEQTGDAARGEAACRQVIDDPRSATTLVPTDTLGLSRTLASEAELSLLRLKSAKAAAAPMGLSQTDLPRLAVQSVASLAWNAPSYILPAAGEAFAPVVWVRPDGLAAQGPGGGVRWLFRGMPDADNRLAWAATNGSIVALKDHRGVVAHKLTSGEIAWRWRPELGDVLAEPPGGRQVIAAQVLRHLYGPAGAALLGWPAVAAPGEAAADFIAAGASVVVSTPSEKEAPSLLCRIDAASGEESWSFDLTAGLVHRDTFIEGGRVIAVMQSPDGRFQVLAFDELSGNQLWQFNATVPAGRKVAWLAQGGVFIVNDSAGQCAALRTGDGGVLWQKEVDRRWLPGARPVAVIGDCIVFDCDQGYASVTVADGRLAWRVSVPADPVRPKSHALADGRLIACGADGLTAIDVAAGRVLWRRPYGDFGEADAGLAACNDLLIVHGRRPAQAALHFVDPAKGTLLGDLPLGFDGADVTVQAIRGGLLVQCGDQVLTVCPSADAGPAVSPPVGPLAPTAVAAVAGPPDEPLSTLSYSGDDLAAGPGKMTIRCARGDRGLWEMDLVRTKDGRDVQIHRFDDLTDSGDFNYATHERNPQGLLSVHLLRQVDRSGFIELHKGQDACEFALREASDKFVVLTRYRIVASDSEGMQMIARRTFINTSGGPLKPLPTDQMTVSAALGVGSFDGRKKGARCRLDEKVDAQGRRYHRTPDDKEALWVVRENCYPGGNPKFDRTKPMWFEATVLAGQAAKSLGLKPGRQFRLDTDLVGYYPAGNVGRVWLNDLVDYTDGLYVAMAPREWYGTRREDNNNVGLAAGETATKTFTLKVNIPAK